MLFALRADVVLSAPLWQPFKESRKQFEELVNVTCDVISALLAMALVAVAEAGGSASNVPIGVALIALQVFPILVTVLNA